jgi:hypothetical protein
MNTGYRNFRAALICASCVVVYFKAAAVSKDFS